MMYLILFYMLTGKCLSFQPAFHHHRTYSRIETIKNKQFRFIKYNFQMNGNSDSSDDLKVSLLKHLTLVSKSPFITIPSTPSSSSFSANELINNNNNTNVFTIDPNIKFSTDVMTGTGAFLYEEMNTQWSNYLIYELVEPVFSIDQISYIQQDTINVKWNVTFIPESLLSIVKFARTNPLWKVSFFNVLDREKIQSSFSWQSLFKFLERVILKGEVVLPHAAIVGSTDFQFKPIFTTSIPTTITITNTGTTTSIAVESISSINRSLNITSATSNTSNNSDYDSLDSSVSSSSSSSSLSSSSTISNNEFARSMPVSTAAMTTSTTTSISALATNQPTKWVLLSSKESLNLVRSIDKGYLKNRKLATDLLEFLDARRPLNLGLDEWNDVLLKRISTKNIPGMRQLDVDGLSAEQQNDALEGVSKVLGLFTGLVLISSIFFGTMTMNKVFSYRESHDKSKVIGTVNSPFDDADADSDDDNMNTL